MSPANFLNAKTTGETAWKADLSLSDTASQKIALSKGKQRLSALLDLMKETPQWGASAGLIDFLQEQLRMAEGLEKRLTAKPVIAVVGSTGSGKSTLVNALVGRDDCVRAGHERPTTRTVTAVMRSASDADQLLSSLSSMELVVESVPDTRFPHAVILDFPDTDSAEAGAYSDLIDRALGLADILLCVFDVENPKRKDHLDRMLSWVERFPARHLLLILNRCDRVPQDQLNQEVLPDFRARIQRAWEGACDEIFLVSARDALRSPGWEQDGIAPLHHLNQFHELVQRLQQTGNLAHMADERVAHIQHLCDQAERLVRQELDRQGDWRKLAQEVDAFEKKVCLSHLESLITSLGQANGQASVVLSGAVANRWWGPVGTFLGMGRRLRDFWTPFRLFAALNPILLFRGLSRGFRALRDPAAAERLFSKEMAQETENGDLTAAKETASREWSELGARLVREYAMDPALRYWQSALDCEVLTRCSRSIWAQVMEKAIERIAIRQSRMWIQWLANLPVLTLAVAVVVQLALHFYQGNYFPQMFYWHTLALMFFAWLIPSWLIQFRMKRAVEQLPAEMLRFLGENATIPRILPVAGQIHLLASFQNGCGTPPSSKD